MNHHPLKIGTTRNPDESAACDKTIDNTCNPPE